MSYTNSTTNYHLPQYINTDIPSYLVDQNGAWSTVDTTVKAVSDVADAAKTKADTNEGNIITVTATANSAESKGTGALANEADAYSATSTYTVGDLVIYNNLLYRCITDISVAEAFNGDHWTITNLETEIDTVKSNLAALASATSGSTSVTGSKTNDQLILSVTEIKNNSKLTEVTIIWETKVSIAPGSNVTITISDILTRTPSAVNYNIASISSNLVTQSLTTAGIFRLENSALSGSPVGIGWSGSVKFVYMAE